MKVLIACEELQVECKAFRKRGHEAYSCDVKECTGGHEEWHILGDVLDIIRGGCLFTTMDGVEHTIDGKWDLIIAHPPCTYITNAGAVRLYKEKGVLNYERFSEGLKAKVFFMHFWLYGWFGCGKIAIENPIPSSVFEMPLKTQAIQPYEFGDPYLKKTYLWLFGLPKLVPTNIVKPICSWVSGGSKTSNGKQRRHNGMTFRDSKTRSQLFEGILNAMAEQWGNLN